MPIGSLWCVGPATQRSRARSTHIARDWESGLGSAKCQDPSRDSNICHVRGVAIDNRYVIPLCKTQIIDCCRRLTMDIAISLLPSCRNIPSLQLSLQNQPECKAVQVAAKPGRVNKTPPRFSIQECFKTCSENSINREKEHQQQQQHSSRQREAHREETEYTASNDGGSHQTLESPRI